MRKTASSVALLAVTILALALLTPPAHAAGPKTDAKKAGKQDGKADEKPKGPFSAETFAGLALRSIGPALTSGRVIDLVVDPTDAKRWFVAAASGGVWRTENAGTTWTPIFDGEGSYLDRRARARSRQSERALGRHRREQLASARSPTATASTSRSTAARASSASASRSPSTSAGS